MNTIAKPPMVVDENRSKATAGEIFEDVIARGDIAKLKPVERAQFIVRLCESLGLNPLTRPIEIISMKGKEVPYVKRDGTDQLRKLHSVSVLELSETERDGVFIVTAKVRDAAGRVDIATGAVNIANLKGETLANALMTAETKAKRRATLSICGLGFLDETEIDSMIKDDAERDIANGISIHHPDDYVGDGTRERDTKPPEEKKFTRILNALQIHNAKADAMCHELEVCTTIPELDAMALELEERQEYKNLPRHLWDKLSKTYLNRLAELQCEVVWEDGTELPAREDNPSISERAIAARKGS